MRQDRQGVRVRFDPVRTDDDLHSFGEVVSGDFGDDTVGEAQPRPDRLTRSPCRIQRRPVPTLAGSRLGRRRGFAAATVLAGAGQASSPAHLGDDVLHARLPAEGGVGDEQDAFRAPRPRTGRRAVRYGRRRPLELSTATTTV